MIPDRLGVRPSFCIFTARILAETPYGGSDTPDDPSENDRMARPAQPAKRGRASWSRSCRPKSKPCSLGPAMRGEEGRLQAARQRIQAAKEIAAEGAAESSSRFSLSDQWSRHLFVATECWRLRPPPIPPPHGPTR